MRPGPTPLQTVACTTYLVQPGFFDIFFPTDFHLLRDMYSLVMSPSPASLPKPFSASASPRIGADFFSSSSLARAYSRRDAHDSATSGQDSAVPPSSATTAVPGGGVRSETSRGSGSGIGSGRVGARGLTVLDHAEFLERWGETEMTRVQDGSNPMLDSYRNAAFIL